MIVLKHARRELGIQSEHCEDIRRGLTELVRREAAHVHHQLDYTRLDRLVKSFAHPDTNATGFFTFDPPMSGKWLELLKEIAPGIARAAIMFNPNTWTLRDYSLAVRSAVIAFNVAGASGAFSACPTGLQDRRGSEASSRHTD